MKRLILALAVAAFAGHAFADDLPGTPVALLTFERVQKEIKLTEKQTTALKGLAAEVKKNETKLVAAHTRVAKTLEPEQLARLEQISYQVRGGRALSDEKVIAALRLTKDQVDKVGSTWKTEEEDLQGFLKRARFVSETARQEHIRKHQRKAAEKMLEVLTNEQKKEFTRMQGKAFETDGLDKD